MALLGCGWFGRSTCPEGAVDELRVDLEQVAQATKEGQPWQASFDPVRELPVADLPFVASDAFLEVGIAADGSVRPELEPLFGFCDELKAGVENLGGIRLEAHRDVPRARVEEVLQAMGRCGQDAVDVVLLRAEHPVVAEVVTPEALRPLEEAVLAPMDPTGRMPDLEPLSAPLEEVRRACPIDERPVATAASELKPILYVQAIVPALEDCGCAVDLDVVRWHTRMSFLPRQWLTVVPVDPASPPSDLLARWPEA